MCRFQNNSFIFTECLVFFRFRFFFSVSYYFAEGHYHYHINLNTVWTHSFIQLSIASQNVTQGWVPISDFYFYFDFRLCNRYRQTQTKNQSRQTSQTNTALDSSGNPESGFVLGQSFWLGSIKGCEAVQNPHTLTLSNRFERMMHANLQKARAPFDIGYRVVYATHTSPWQIQVEFLLDAAVSCWHHSFEIISPQFVCINLISIYFSISLSFPPTRTQRILHIGLCLPTSCSNEQIASLSQEYFDSEVLDAQNVLELHPNVMDVKDLNVKTDFMQKGSVQMIG